MADYWVDDGGDDSDGTVTGKWAGAKVSIESLVAAFPAALTTSGNRIFIGDDHNDPNVVAAKTYTGPTSGLPVILISADRTDNSAVPAYKVGTGNQLSSLGGSYSLTVDGSFALYGITISSGTNGGLFLADDNETMMLSGCTIYPAANGSVGFTRTARGTAVINNLTIDLAADAGSARTGPVVSNCYGGHAIDGLVILNGSNRTGAIFGPWTNGVSRIKLSGVDVSSCSDANCEIFNPTTSWPEVVLTNCVTKASPVMFTSGVPSVGGSFTLTNVGSTDEPISLWFKDYFGDVVATSAIYRTSGAAVEGDACSWLITTTANCSEGSPFYTPWMYGVVDSTGSKAFDCYITNDTADFTDAQVWLEVEYLATADDAKWTLATDQRTTITTTAVAQDDDTTSTWNGTGPSFTYKQKLSVPAVIGEVGQFRARVAVGVASIAGSRYFYCDPAITVT